MPGLDPGIHDALQQGKEAKMPVDCRVKPGNDNCGACLFQFHLTQYLPRGRTLPPVATGDRVGFFGRNLVRLQPARQAAVLARLAFFADLAGLRLADRALFFVWQRVKRGRRVRARTILRALFPERILRSRSNEADIGYLFFNVFVFGVMFGWAVLSYQFISNGIIAGLVALFGPVSPSTLPVYVTRSVVTVMLFLAYELGYWFNHWLSHKVPLLWEFHKVHHNAEVLTPLTNFRVHPVYTWIFTNILAFSTAVANGFGNYMFGETAYQYALSDTNIILVVVHSCLCASPAFAHVDFLPRRAWARLRKPRASPGASLVQSETLQQELRLLPGHMGLGVRHALRAGEET